MSEGFQYAREVQNAADHQYASQQKIIVNQRETINNLRKQVADDAVIIQSLEIGIKIFQKALDKEREGSPSVSRSTHIDRMKVEYDDLAAKIEKLKEFRMGKVFGLMSKADQNLLDLQHTTMNQYLQILSARIDAAEEQISAPEPLAVTA